MTYERSAAGVCGAAETGLRRTFDGLLAGLALRCLPSVTLPPPAPAPNGVALVVLLVLSPNADRLALEGPGVGPPFAGLLAEVPGRVPEGVDCLPLLFRSLKSFLGLAVLNDVQKYQPLNSYEIKL